MLDSKHRSNRSEPVWGGAAEPHRGLEDRILIAGPSGPGESTLCHFFRERGANGVDGDEAPGSGGAVVFEGRPPRSSTKDQ
jgi:hypothetical protein